MRFTARSSSSTARTIRASRPRTSTSPEGGRAWASVRVGSSLRYPILSDAEFFSRGEALGNDRALFLVGNARSNRVTRELEPELPIRVQDGKIAFASEKMSGQELGAAFV